MLLLYLFFPSKGLDSIFGQIRVRFSFMKKKYIWKKSLFFKWSNIYTLKGTSILILVYRHTIAHDQIQRFGCLKKIYFEIKNYLSLQLNVFKSFIYNIHDNFKMSKLWYVSRNHCLSEKS